MKSNIKIGTNEKRNPVINLYISSDISDLRDKTCRQFVEDLGYSSNFCFIECRGTESQGNLYEISPVGSDLRSLELLQERLSETIKTIKSVKSPNN